jgi:hypothetical protein
MNLTQKEQIKRLKIEKVLLFISLFMWVGIGLVQLYFIVRPSYYSQTYVDYSQLNQSQKVTAYQIISEVKPLFLHLAKNIRFVTNQSEMTGIDVAGENHNKGKKVLVLWYDDIDSTKFVLCHELAHSITSNLDEDTEEKIVYEIGSTGVCYV